MESASDRLVWLLQVFNGYLSQNSSVKMIQRIGLQAQPFRRVNVHGLHSGCYKKLHLLEGSLELFCSQRFAGMKFGWLYLFRTFYGYFTS